MHLRKIPISTTVKLPNILDPPTEIEKDILKKWDQCTYEAKKYLHIYEKYSPGDLVNYLTVKNRHDMPFPGSLISPKKARIMGYYLLMNFPVIFETITFTMEQNSVINMNTGIYIINAGPGTGKTTTATEKAYILRDEGVLLISYTNSTINENYFRFHEYMGIKKYVGKKNYTKKINIVTVDSLARNIIKEIPENYDICVRLAIDQLDNYRNIYQHIIVDEAQDIDDLRGLLIKNLYLTGRYKSISIFGDPRQRITENCGNWYQQLWNENKLGNHEIKKIGFTLTHRFINNMMINLVNDLSSQRPDIHVMLTNSLECYNEVPIDVIKISKKNEDSCYKHISQYIIDLVKNGYNYTDICVIGPSLDKSNSASVTAQKICAVFKDSNIPCYISAEGSFKPTGVLFGTIHSVKGKEYKIVILYGISGYPESYPMIGYYEGESLIYVAHSRAKHKIIYIMPDCIVLPRGIDPKYLSNPNLHFANIKSSDYICSNFEVSEVCQNHDFHKLVYSNNYLISGNEMLTGPCMPDKPEEFDSRLWGILSGLGVNIVLSNKYPDIFYKLLNQNIKYLPHKEYRKLYRQGIICKGINIQTNELVFDRDLVVNQLWDNELLELKNIISKPIHNLVWNDWLHLTKIYDYLRGGHMNSRYDLPTNVNINLTPYFIDISVFLNQQFGKLIDSEKLISINFIHGMYDLKFNNYIIELKTVKQLTDEHRIQSLIYTLDNLEYTPLLYNIQTGIIEKVSSNCHYILWRYLIDSYGVIRNHKYITELRKNNRKIRKLPNFVNTYVCDTEFYNNSDIFEISVLNLNDIFSSIVQPIKPTSDQMMTFAIDWMLTHRHNWSKPQLYQLLNNSRTEYEISSLIFRITDLYGSLNLSKFYYYIARIDVKLCPEFHHDISKYIKILSNIYGINLNHGSPPKLESIYSCVCYPIELQHHLNPHVALSDTLLLYELIFLKLYEYL